MNENKLEGHNLKGGSCKIYKEKFKPRLKFRPMTPAERAEELECWGLSEDEVQNDNDGQGDYIEVLEIVENGTPGDDYEVDERWTRVYLQMKVKEN